jgi:hypothetical protein
MGFWSKLGGYAMMVGGVAAAGYTGGASLSLVGAGANMVANDEKKEGAKKAAAQQEAAANKAIATQEKAAQASTAAYKPYTQTGSAAMGALGSFMGLPSTMSASPPGGVVDDTVVGSLPAATQQGLGVRAPGSPTPTGRAAVTREGATPQTQAAQATASGYGGTLGGMAGGGMVQMRAPTGMTQWVPREQAPFYAARGAQEVR